MRSDPEGRNANPCATNLAFAPRCSSSIAAYVCRGFQMDEHLREEVSQSRSFAAHCRLSQTIVTSKDALLKE